MFELMRQDFKERKEGESFWIETTKHLMDKLSNRDKEIQKLRSHIRELEIQIKTLES